MMTEHYKTMSELNKIADIGANIEVSIKYLRLDEASQMFYEKS